MRNTNPPESPSANLSDSNRFFTVSNLLSISRVLLTIPFVVVMLSDLPSSRIFGAVILAAAALTDKLDGVLARKYHQVTEWGKMLDPIADKIGVAVVALVLLHLNAVPIWFVMVILARDLLIFIGGWYLKVRRGVVLQSNEVGKWAVGFITLTLFLLLLDIESLLIEMLIWASVAMLAVSFALYAARFVETLRGQTKLNTET